ncbi:MAG: Endolytic murein transglycosylase [Bacteroidetes bacterium]|nr:Endolytic murein transglycosylase [Bacteroidota bacterium]
MSRKTKSRLLFLIVLLILGISGFYVYHKFFGASVKLSKNYTFIYIENGDKLEDIISSMNSEKIISDTESFKWLAQKMELDKNIHPGKYRIINGMSMRQIINLIKYGKEEKVKLTYNSQIHDLDEFVVYTADKLEMNESEIEDYLTDEKKLKDDFDLDPDNAFALITPGVYEVSWAISTEALFTLLQHRFKETWNDRRISKAKKNGFSVPEIITLASIVQSESSIRGEQEKIAGVYINRLNTGMPLQADPTLKFANKDYGAQRVWDNHKESNSPYNTYKYKGLPPGPICLVGLQAIDATLNYSKHKFLFFCAKCELNGLSDYSTTYEQHRKFAEKYQKAMDKRGIK